MNGDKTDHIFLGESDLENAELEINILAKKAYLERKSQTFESNEDEYFAEVFPRKNRLVVIGAAHIALDLIDFGNQFNFETIVIDPRGIFNYEDRFESKPDQLFKNWPEEIIPELNVDADTYCVLLTHDPKIDDQALHLLLKSNVAYIGALGSTRTHEKRVNRLLSSGFSQPEIDRIHGPVGVDIKAKRPKEVALSIIGEVLKVRNSHL